MFHLFNNMQQGEIIREKIAFAFDAIIKMFRKMKLEWNREI